jgi:hypothetical protein
MHQFTSPHTRNPQLPDPDLQHQIPGPLAYRDHDGTSPENKMRRKSTRSIGRYLLGGLRQQDAGGAVLGLHQLLHQHAVERRDQTLRHCHHQRFLLLGEQVAARRPCFLQLPVGLLLPARFRVLTDNRVGGSIFLEKKGFKKVG